MFGTLNIAFSILLILWKFHILKIFTSLSTQIICHKLNFFFLSQVEKKKIQTKNIENSQKKINTLFALPEILYITNCDDF